MSDKEMTQTLHHLPFDGLENNKEKCKSESIWFEHIFYTLAKGIAVIWLSRLEARLYLYMLKAVLPKTKSRNLAPQQELLMKDNLLWLLNDFFLTGEVLGR